MESGRIAFTRQRSLVRSQYRPRQSAGQCQGGAVAKWVGSGAVLVVPSRRRRHPLEQPSALVEQPPVPVHTTYLPDRCVASSRLIDWPVVIGAPQTGAIGSVGPSDRLLFGDTPWARRARAVPVMPGRLQAERRASVRKPGGGVPRGVRSPSPQAFRVPGSLGIITFRNDGRDAGVTWSHFRPQAPEGMAAHIEPAAPGRKRYC